MFIFSYLFKEEFMPKAYSPDLRERVLKDCDAGMRSEDVAKKYSVSASWVYDLRKKRRETGSITPKKLHHPQKTTTRLETKTRTPRKRSPATRRRTSRRDTRRIL